MSSVRPAPKARVSMYQFVIEWVTNYVRDRASLAHRLIIPLSKLVTLKYTQYGGEGYLRGGD